MNGITLDKAIRAGDIQLGRGNIISSKDIAKYPGDYPIYSSSAKGSGEFGRYGHYMFDEELITWSVDGGGRFFFRPKHKFSVTNVCGYMRVDGEKWNRQFVYYVFDFQHQRITFDYQTKAHPSVIRHLYSLPNAPEPEQTKIAEILSTVDQAIERTETLIAKQQRIKTGLMQDLLTRGIDKNGNLRSEETHEFKDSPLGRIPVEWVTKKLEDLTIRIGDGIHSTPNYSEHTDYFFINGNNLGEGSIHVTSNTLCVDEREYRKYFIGLDERTILYSINGTIGNIAFYKGEKVILGKSAAYIMCKPSVNEKLIYYVLQSQPVKKFYEYEMTGSTIRNLSLSAIRNTPIKMPSNDDEQELIAKKIESLSEAVNDQKLSLTKLNSLKTALMQDLLTGKVSVVPLLTDTEGGVGVPRRE